MFWLGLLLSVCYVPGYVGASVPTQWAVLSILLPLGLWRMGPTTFGHKLFLISICWALLSLCWTKDYLTAGWGLWLMFIWALSYHWGTLCDDLRSLWKGLAVGLFVSVGVCIAQSLDYAPVEAFDPLRPTGLFFNSSLFGVILALVLVALACHRLWWYMPPLALGLVLSGSRGGIVVLAVGLIARFGGALAVLALICAAGIAFTVTLDLADIQRLQIWGVTLRAIRPLGQGPGSFIDLHYFFPAKAMLIRPEYAHNDILQLLFEYGIGAVPTITIFWLALANRSHRDWPVAVAFGTLALFYFPLYAPLTAFIGCVVAGSCLRDWALVRNLMRGRRHDVVPRLEDGEFGNDRDRGKAIPLVS